MLKLITNSINKAMIVCPVTLVDNWRKEFRKWSVQFVESCFGEAC